MLYDGDFMPWDGGKCPVEKGTFVDVIHRSGAVHYQCRAGMSGNAEDWITSGFSSDITYYRLCEKLDSWEYIKGGPEDFEGARRYVTVRITVGGSNEYWAESFSMGALFQVADKTFPVEGELAGIYCNGRVIAERKLKTLPEKYLPKAGDNVIFYWKDKDRNPKIIKVTAVGENSFLYKNEGSDVEDSLVFSETLVFQTLPTGATLEAFDALRATFGIGTSLALLKAIKEGSIPHLSFND